MTQKEEARLKMLELLSPFVIISSALLAFFLFYRIKTKHMRDLSDGIPGMSSLPWITMMKHFVSQSNKSNFSKFVGDKFYIWDSIKD